MSIEWNGMEVDGRLISEELQFASNADGLVNRWKNGYPKSYNSVAIRIDW